MTSSEEIAQILLSINAVTLNPQHPYRYATNLLSPIYTDCRLLMSYPKERGRVIELMSNLLNKNNLPDVVCGTATAGIPHAAWLAEFLNLPLIYCRSKNKEHGKRAQIEGYLENTSEVVVVEDLISTGASSIETVQTIRNSGAIADTVLAIFSYGLKQSRINFNNSDITLLSLTNFTTLIKMAVNDGYLSANDHKLIMDWQTDPVGWGKTHGFK